MRNPLKFAEISAFPAGVQLGNRSTRKGRETLFFAASGLLALAAIAYPFALYALTVGIRLPFLLASIAMAGGGVALALHMHKRYAIERACLLVTAAALGLTLTLADPDIFDFGLAVLIGAAILAVRERSAGATAAQGVWGGEGAERRAFADFIESVPDAVAGFGADGTLRYLSRSTSRLLACQRYELDNGGFFERIHVMDRPAYMAAISSATRRGKPAHAEMRMRRDSDTPGRSAHYVWIEISLSPVGEAAPGANARDVIGVMRDITVRKDAEGEADKARREAEQASEAKSRFLATIGHELRTPLNAIVGFSDMMQAGIGGTLAPGHMEYAGHIRQSGLHLLEVVNMLLDMSKIEAGKFEISTDLFAPDALVDPCMQLVEKQAIDKGVTLTRAMAPGLPQVVADERACRQILINLLSNAVKFSHEGGEVQLAMRRQGKMLAVAVSDSGVGMTPETIRRIGEPFLQEQGGLSRRYEGTGLGLSIVKGLVGLHDGQLHVTSEPGIGTTVTVLLPLDGPERTRKPHSAEIAVLHTGTSRSDEDKWQHDERQSAAR
ncbi:PAS domain-containing sensor histidine kinase [Pelagibacterium xiamenense]|uniref:PAS domain-containing sensor histidine kinase n=1 Tax=Pelagibacterium xiamenense TaxID=2901140 RepID=UPI001E5996A3|nr:ATP-binding protein [Pelagibacterium xiamenense]MCD7059430.1 ATP-binding protein [Pelagibacterium xiamenense]